jgi:hypothetical protein
MHAKPPKLLKLNEFPDTTQDSGEGDNQNDIRGARGEHVLSVIRWQCTTSSRQEVSNEPQTTSVGEAAFPYSRLT